MKNRSLLTLWALIIIFILLIINTFINIQYTLYTEPVIQNNEKQIILLNRKMETLQKQLEE